MNSSFIYRNISLLYRALEEIQKNIGYVARRGETFSDNRRAGNLNQNNRNYVINNDQRVMIETYGKMYDTILRHVEFLYSQLLFISHQPNPNINRHSNLAYFNGHYYNVHPTGDPESTNSNNINQNANSQTQTQPQQPYVLRPHAADYTMPPLPTGLPANPGQRTYIRTTQRNLETPGVMFTRAMGNFNDPVIVTATTEQIANATSNLLYENIEEPRNDRCPICLDVFQPNSEVTQINHCGHIFNRTQLATWFGSNVRCPVCRFDIRDNVATTQPHHVDQSVQSNESASVADSASTDSPGANPSTPPASFTHTNSSRATTFNNQLVDIFDTFANEAVQSMFNASDTAASQILTNLFNNNIENLAYDASGSSIMFDTFVYPRR